MGRDLKAIQPASIKLEVWLVAEVIPARSIVDTSVCKCLSESYRNQRGTQPSKGNTGTEVCLSGKASVDKQTPLRL